MKKFFAVLLVALVMCGTAGFFPGISAEAAFADGYNGSTYVGAETETISYATKTDEEIFIDTPYHVEGVTLPFSLKDRGYIDDEGSLHFLGRKDDICNINGLKISLNKVENALRKILDIDEAALLPFRQNDSDVLCAFIPGSEKQNKTALIRELRTYLTDFEIPKYLDTLSPDFVMRKAPASFKNCACCFGLHMLSVLLCGFIFFSCNLSLAIAQFLQHIDTTSKSFAKNFLIR